MPIDRLKNTMPQALKPQPMPKLQKRGPVRRTLMAKVNADKLPNSMTVVYCSLDAFNGEPKALLSEGYAQHALQANQRAYSLVALRVEGLEPSVQCRPRYGTLDPIGARSRRVGFLFPAYSRSEKLYLIDLTLISVQEDALSRPKPYRAMIACQ